jgi:hypothetical protein
MEIHTNVSRFAHAVCNVGAAIWAGVDARLYMVRVAPGVLARNSCGFLLHQNVPPAIGKQHHKAHDQERKIVVPAGSLLSPEAGVPHEYFLLNGS